MPNTRLHGFCSAPLLEAALLVPYAGHGPFQFAVMHNCKRNVMIMIAATPSKENATRCARETRMEHPQPAPGRPGHGAHGRGCRPAQTGGRTNQGARQTMLLVSNKPCSQLPRRWPIDQENRFAHSPLCARVRPRAEQLPPPAPKPPHPPSSCANVTRSRLAAAKMRK